MHVQPGEKREVNGASTVTTNHILCMRNCLEYIRIKFLVTCAAFASESEPIAKPPCPLVLGSLGYRPLSERNALGRRRGLQAQISRNFDVYEPVLAMLYQIPLMPLIYGRSQDTRSVLTTEIKIEMLREQILLDTCYWDNKSFTSRRQSTKLESKALKPRSKREDVLMKTNNPGAKIAAGTIVSDPKFWLQGCSMFIWVTYEPGNSISLHNPLCSSWWLNLDNSQGQDHDRMGPRGRISCSRAEGHLREGHGA